MDNNDRRSRQNTQSSYSSQQAAGTLLPQQSSPQYPPTASSDRYRQNPLAVQPGASAAASGRAAGNLQQYNTYQYAAGAEGGNAAAAAAPFAGPGTGTSMQAGALQYPPGAGDYSQDSSAAAASQRQQQGGATGQQQYQQYGMYNVQQQQQATPPSPYESVQPYQPRQSAAIEVLSNQFGVPQSYYVGGEGGPTSAPNAAIATQNVQSQYNPISYTTQSPVGRESLAYAAGMADPAQAPSSQAAYNQASNYASQAAADLDNAYGSYQTELRRTFESVREGHLGEAGTSLIRISDWLLSNAEALGLVRDDEGMHGERLKLWTEFNTCWLSVLQAQKDATTAMIQSGQRPSAPQTLLDQDQMETMGKELVRLCDIMEKHGLVDYQMGVWEEEIITLLTQCLDLLDSSGAIAPPAQASSSRRR